MDAAQVADVEGTVASALVLLGAGGLLLRLGSPQSFERLRGRMSGAGTGLAAAVAISATAGSLWFSEGAHFPPCELCWYQRIAMYPLAVLLPLAAWRHDRTIRPYALVTAGAALGVSLLHNFVETFPSRDPGGCDPANPCTIRWVEGLGFWTIPRMAAVAFVAIIAVIALDRDPQEVPS